MCSFSCIAPLDQRRRNGNCGISDGKKHGGHKKAASAPVTEEVLEVAELPTAPGSAGKLKIHNVEPKTAAMLMAIVADKLQKPINELRFISIKEVE